jgi:hypothetical protein
MTSLNIFRAFEQSDRKPLSQQKPRATNFQNRIPIGFFDLFFDRMRHNKFID